MPLWRMILTAINLVGFRLGGAVLGMVSQIVLARLLPQHDVGVVLMAMSAAALISLVMTVGYPALSMTCLPRYYALGRTSLAEAYHRAAWHDILIVSAVVAVVVVAVVLFGPLDDGVNLALIFGLLTAPASSLIRLTSSTANSLKRFSLSYIPDFLFRPGLLMAFLLLCWAAGIALSVTMVLWALVTVAMSVALFQAWLLGAKGPLAQIFRRGRHRLAPVLRGRAMAMVIVAAVAVSFADIVTLVGGLYLPSNAVAELGIAVRLAALAGFVTQVTQQFVLPDLASAITKGARKEAQSLLFRSNILTLSALTACVIGAGLFGPWILMIFGAEYANAHWPLVLFMVSQFFRAAGGMNQHLLSIDGYQGRSAISCVFAVAALTAVSALLAPRYGVMGVAVAAVIADALWAAALGLQAQRYSGYRGDIFAVLRFK